MYYQARPEEGATGGQFSPGPKRKRDPRAQAQERLPQHTDKFISFMFQIKIKLLIKIHHFCLIDPVCLFIERWVLTH